MPLGLPKKHPCECGGVADLISVKRKRILMDGIAVVNFNFPIYKCKKCRSKWIPYKIMEWLRRALVAGIIQTRTLGPAQIRFARKTMGLTQEEMAKALGLRGGKSLFSKYESGEQIPQGATTQAIGLFIEKWFRDGIRPSARTGLI